MIALGVLAQDGKIPERAINCGIRANDQNDGQRIGCLAEREFFRWYDKELEKHGVEQRIVFRSDVIGQNGLNLSYHLTPSTPLTRGYYCWCTELGLNTRTIYMEQTKFLPSYNPQKSLNTL